MAANKLTGVSLVKIAEFYSSPCQVS